MSRSTSPKPSKCLWILLLAWLTSLGLSLSAHAQVGMRTLQADDLSITVSYPTEAPNQPLSFGAFEVHAAKDAPPKRGNERLLVLSHGTGGSAFSDYALVTKLVEAGYIVAQPLHRGDNYKDHSKAGPKSWKTRPSDLSTSIDAVKADAQLGPLFDAQRVGVHGMSAGGHTALVMAGGQWNLLGLVQHCAKALDEDVGFCLNGTAQDPDAKAKRLAQFQSLKGVPEHYLPESLKTLYGGANPSDAPQALGSRPDVRVRAVSVMVPVVAPFTPQSLQALSIPIAVVGAADDQVLNPKFHSDYLLKQCKTCVNLKTLQNAGHFDVLDPWPKSVAESVSKTQIRGGMPHPNFLAADRAAAQAAIVAFFDRHLR